MKYFFYYRLYIYIYKKFIKICTFIVNGRSYKVHVFDMLKGELF